MSEETQEYTNKYIKKFRKKFLGKNFYEKKNDIIYFYGF